MAFTPSCLPPVASQECVPSPDTPGAAATAQRRTRNAAHLTFHSSGMSTLYRSAAGGPSIAQETCAVQHTVRPQSSILDTLVLPKKVRSVPTLREKVTPVKVS